MPTIPRRAGCLLRSSAGFVPPVFPTPRSLARRPSCKGERLAVVRLALLAEGILPGLGWLPGQRERRERGAAFLLLVPLRLRLLLFLVAAHLTFGHDVPPVLACPPCAGGAGIEAPPAHGFKRSLASVDSALARILCGSRTAGSRGR